MGLHHVRFFGPVLVSIYLALHLYFLWWTSRYFTQSPRQSRAFKLFLALLATLLPAAQYLQKSRPGVLTDAFIRLGFVWLGAMLILVTVLILCDLLRPVLRLARAARPADRELGWFSLGLAAALISLAVYQGGALPRVKPMEVGLRNLPAALDGFKVVQLSDVHIGRIVSVERFRKIAERVNALNPDLIVFTGDITENGVEDPAGVCAVIRSMNAKYGKAGVMGNHDSFAGAETAAGFYSGCGIRMLSFEKYEPAPGLQVAGADDPRRGARPANGLAPLLSSLSASKALIFLSHRPEGLAPVMLAAPGLILSGHTHEGQIYPFGFIEMRVYKYFYGLYKEGDTSVYVTSGAGTWGPSMRLFTANELPLFVLRRKR